MLRTSPGEHIEDRERHANHHEPEHHDVIQRDHHHHSRPCSSMCPWESTSRRRCHHQHPMTVTAAEIHVRWYSFASAHPPNQDCPIARVRIIDM